MILHSPRSLSFFFNDTATTEIYTLSLHDALPIYCPLSETENHFQWVNNWSKQTGNHTIKWGVDIRRAQTTRIDSGNHRSEEHTSELQSQSNLVCRLLLEKKKKKAVTRSLVIESRS